MHGRRIYGIVCVLSLVVVLFGVAQARADAILTYDDFASGTISSDLWNTSGNASPSMFSVQPGGAGSFSQPYVLHMTGNGGATYPGSNLKTKTNSQFIGTGFAVVINYANFSYTGTAPGGSDSKYPSINLLVGDFTVNPFFLVGRSSNPGGEAVSWRQYSADGSSILGQGWIPYAQTSGGLVITFQQNGQQNGLNTGYDVNLGYFNTTDPATWGEASFHSLLLNPFATFFNGAPFARISAQGGSQSGGTVTADVGGLYYTSIGAPVPLPGALLLLAPGLGGLLLVRRRFRK